MAGESRALRTSAHTHGRTRPHVAGIAHTPRIAILRALLLPLHADPCPPKTRADLQWDRLLAAIADRCAGPLGRDCALGLAFAPTREEARAWMAQAREASRLLEEGRP